MRVYCCLSDLRGSMQSVNTSPTLSPTDLSMAACRYLTVKDYRTLFTVVCGAGRIFTATMSLKQLKTVNMLLILKRMKSV